MLVQDHSSRDKLTKEKKEQKVTMFVNLMSKLKIQFGAVKREVCNILPKMKFLGHHLSLSRLLKFIHVIKSIFPRKKRRRRTVPVFSTGIFRRRMVRDTARTPCMYSSSTLITKHF